jgi:hypothetical protein
MQYELANAPEMGFRTDNKQRSERLVDALDVIIRDLGVPSCIANLVDTSAEYEAEQQSLVETEEWELEDLDKLWLKKTEKAAKEVAGFCEQAKKLKEQFKKIMVNPPGADLRAGYQQTHIACGMLFLWLELSWKRPTAAGQNSKTRNKSEFCRASSLLGQALGRRYNLQRACQTIIKTWIG